jgi:hypothetical protein
MPLSERHAGDILGLPGHEFVHDPVEVVHQQAVGDAEARSRY